VLLNRELDDGSGSVFLAAVSMVLFDHRAATNLPDVLTGARGFATDAPAGCSLAIATRITVFRLEAQGPPTVIGDCLQCQLELIAAYCQQAGPNVSPKVD
jgi:hypothetical protein